MEGGGIHDPFSSSPQLVDPNSLKRPRFARKQADNITHAYEAPVTGLTSEYNIWYHKYLGDGPPQKKTGLPSETKCDPERDSGVTRADSSKELVPLCLYFARGKCVAGRDCPFFHRIPNEEDEKKTPLTQDVFGREKHSNYREDMGGVGTFNKESKTLYVGGLRRVPSNLETVLEQEFSKFGPLEYLRVIWQKMIAFVKFQRRTSAEFAKEAMSDQNVGSDEVLNIRWAHDDLNPLTKKYQERALVKQAATAYVGSLENSQYPTENYLSNLQQIDLSYEPHPYSYNYHHGYKGPTPEYLNAIRNPPKEYSNAINKILSKVTTPTDQQGIQHQPTGLSAEDPQQQQLQYLQWWSSLSAEQQQQYFAYYSASGYAFYPPQSSSVAGQPQSQPQSQSQSQPQSQPQSSSVDLIAPYKTAKDFEDEAKKQKEVESEKLGAEDSQQQQEQQQEQESGDGHEKEGEK